MNIFAKIFPRIPNAKASNPEVGNPEDICKASRLCLSDAQIASIQTKLPRAADGKLYADAVFEGGGVKGTAFLGALRCFGDVGVQWRKVAGTSAGAITAATVAAGFSIAELENVISR